MLKSIKLKRVTLCLLKYKHVTGLLNILNEPDVAQFNDYSLPLNRTDIKNMIQNDVCDYYNEVGIRFAITHINDEVLIGSIGLYDIKEGDAWIGFEISKCYWSYGYMAEVLNYFIVAGEYKRLFNCKITTLYAQVNINNIRCIQLLKKVGFKQQSDDVWVYV